MNYEDEAVGLADWIDGISTFWIDELLEHLEDINCLNEDGKKLRHVFWKKYIETK